MSHFHESSISNFIPNNDRNLTLEIKIIVQFTIDAVDFMFQKMSYSAFDGRVIFIMILINYRSNALNY